jgi:hypothetical protein
MQQKVVATILCVVIVLKLSAQQFIIDLPKQKKNDFANNVVRLLNDAPSYFKETKDKPLKGGDSINYPGITILQNKIRLKGAAPGRIILDTLPFAEYFYGNYKTLEEAEATQVNITNMVAEALLLKVMFKNESGTNALVKQTKIAFTQNSGFFLYNMLVQIYKQEADSSFNVFFKILAGKPAYFYKIPKNEPVNSFMFASALQAQLNTFQKRRWDGCLGSIPPFVCSGTRRNGDTLMVVYTKQGGIDDFPEAVKEFEASLANMKVCMKEDYVYYIPNLPKTKVLKEVVFLKMDDIEKQRPKHVKLSLVEHHKHDYALELCFVYK